MKIAIAASGTGQNANIADEFFNAEYFILYELEDYEHRQVKLNPHKSILNAADIFNALYLMKEDVNVLVTGDCVPNAERILKEGDVKIFKMKGKKVSEAVDMLKTAYSSADVN